VSTIVQIGNGHKAKFWDSPWIDGCAPRDLASRLFMLAWRKNQTVAMDLQNDSWTRGLWKMTSAEEMAELIKLWSLIQEVQLSQEEDQLIWRWSADGVYSAKSAYEVQFRGTYSTLNCSALWKAKAEGKHRFFAWLLLQSRILTADKLLLRNWPCNPTCMLCD
jgi:predicted RNA-binding protein YlxR (DUF448 family)